MWLQLELTILNGPVSMLTSMLTALDVGMLTIQMTCYWNILKLSRLTRYILTCLGLVCCISVLVCRMLACLIAY